MNLQKIFQKRYTPNNKKLYSCLISLLLISGCATLPQNPASRIAVNIPHTVREMKRPGFWISRHPYPDKIILNEEGIAVFNAKLEKELNYIINPLNEPAQYNGKKLKNDLAKEVNNFFKRKLYISDKKLADKNFYVPIEQNMNLAAISEKIDVRYGFLMHYADERLLPTDSLLTVEAGDFEFDELQNSSLDVGTPLIILHESKDGIWVYAETSSSSGWFKKDKIAFCDAQEFKNLLSKKNFAVITAAKADIFLDEDMTKYYDYVRMGTKFAFNESNNGNIIEILIPAKSADGKFLPGKAYIRKEDANIGYLAYTPRNIIEQAFKLLNAPYGWGGTGGEQDCSSYIQEIFQTVGITLPRNSASQGKSGVPLGSFAAGEEKEKLKVLEDDAVAAITILQLKGHVVLYLGMYENDPYVIHETHAYGQKNGLENINMVVNRAVISDLYLGEGSKKGSLLSRIVNIRLIK